MNKIEQISKKLLELGYQKQNFNKPKLEDFKPDNEIDFIIKLGEIVGDTTVAKSMSDEYNKMLLNDFIPDVSFDSDGFDIEIYKDKELVKITTKGESKPINSCGMEIQEVLPFKKIHINDFYKLLIEKNYGIEIILNSGSN
jgi:hypothetical protein